ncbi:purine-nucleoside phosphorylase [Spiroplasma helicoides]|uniref:Purine nucleoside phosphorylase n=1 Tax=Spiroplasma helicoides TaxID=216938 RepID=A0A1B3SLP4_9MOLU|nr:purine-nucleoside phosphorylase [Spiroplasma helicoides]AOG60837.1 purine-nucleoside phosphorylase [Spiroplasma helicoides]
MNKINETVKYLKSQFDQNIDLAIVLGSGLSNLVDDLEVLKEISYNDIPNFKVSDVIGHDSKIIFAKYKEKTILIFKGRFHYYEGYEMDEVVFPIRIIASLKVKKLILTNACGGIGDFLNPGDLMLIKDQIGMFCPSPLRGKNYEEFGTRFPDMTELYNLELQSIAKSSAKEVNINLKEGIYAYFKGPMYETPAEIRAYKILGADAIGMSTVPEAIVAHHAGIKVLAIGLITNKAAGLGGKLSHSEVIETANKSEENFKKLIIKIISKI